jgi:uncharacterized protein YjdB
VTVQPDTATIAPLATIVLTATVRDASGSVVSSPVSWTSSNSAVAQVASDGTVTGLLPGTAVITATSGTASGSATITVKIGG